jgi:O-antigen ligase
VGTYAILAVIVIVIGQSVFGLYDYLLHFLNKSATLTDRTLLWSELLKFKINPIFGTGFESFWLGPRLQTLWLKLWWHPNEAHNGYLETYLNLGLIGLFLFIGVLVVSYAKARAELLRNFELGRFRLAFLLAIVAYNWTEAGVKNISPMWFLLYIIALDYPASEQPWDEPVVEAAQFSDEEQVRLAYFEREDGG